MTAFEPHRYNCHHCSEKQRVVKGCFADAENAFAIIKNEKIFRCLKLLLNDDIELIRELYIRSKNYGNLYACGLLELPNYLYEAFAVMDIEYENQLKARNKNGS